jgi:hypothetical protein
VAFQSIARFTHSLISAGDSVILFWNSSIVTLGSNSFITVSFRDLEFFTLPHLFCIIFHRTIIHKKLSNSSFSCSVCKESLKLLNQGTSVTIHQMNPFTLSSHHKAHHNTSDTTGTSDSAHAHATENQAFIHGANAVNKASSQASHHFNAIL